MTYQASSTNQQLFTIEALRGLAALSVTWFHMTNTYELNWVRYSGYYGGLGVDVFFVISGFIIPYSLHRVGYDVAQFPRFLLRRLVRLEPPYLISIVLALVLWELGARTPGFAGAPPSYSLGQILAHFFYLIPLTDYSWLNVVYWTLAYEFVFYILVGVLWPALSRRSLAFTAALVVAFAVLDIALHKEPTGAPLLFFVGICGARAALGLDRRWISALGIAIAVGVLAWLGQPLAALLALATALLILFVDIPRTPVLEYLGAISYSLYLVHILVGGRVVNIGRRFVDGPLQEFLLSVAALLVSLAMATILWKYVEDPAKRLSKRVELRIAKPA